MERTMRRLAQKVGCSIGAIAGDVAVIQLRGKVSRVRALAILERYVDARPSVGLVDTVTAIQEAQLD